MYSLDPQIDSIKIWAIDACLATVLIHISCVKARRPCPSGSTNKVRGTYKKVPINYGIWFFSLPVENLRFISSLKSYQTGLEDWSLVCVSEI